MTTTTTTTTIGVNIYFWGDDEQRRLLADALSPLTDRLRGAGLLERFWFVSFDRRGPHVLALFTPAPDHRQTLDDELRTTLEHYLRRHPSRVTLDVATLEEMDRQCRGKALCAVDHESGLAENNTLRFFEHPSTGYPFSFGNGMREHDRFWRVMSHLASWTLGRLSAEQSNADAVHFVRAVDRALAPTELAAASVWRHHVGTLLPPVAKRLATGEDDAVLAGVPSWLGGNLRTLDSIWAEREAATSFPGVDELIALAAAADGRSLDLRRRLVREIVHQTLNQLQQPVQNHIPLVLHAWHHHAGRSGGRQAVQHLATTSAETL